MAVVCTASKLSFHRLVPHCYTALSTYLSAILLEQRGTECAFGSDWGQVLTWVTLPRCYRETATNLPKGLGYDVQRFDADEGVS